MLDKIGENTGILGSGMSGLRGEINEISGCLRTVRESVNLMKTQAETQLINIQTNGENT